MRKHQLGVRQCDTCLHATVRSDCWQQRSALGGHDIEPYCLHIARRDLQLERPKRIQLHESKSFHRECYPNQLRHFQCDRFRRWLQFDSGDYDSARQSAC